MFYVDLIQKTWNDPSAFSKHASGVRFRDAVVSVILRCYTLFEQ